MSLDASAGPGQPVPGRGERFKFGHGTPISPLHPPSLQSLPSPMSPQTSTLEPASDPAFALVQEIAGDLSKGIIELPSFPDVAIRVRRVLADDNVAAVKIVEVVGSEPALAARLIRVANSATLNPSGRAVSDLKAAVTRLGHNVIRTAAVAFAVSQVRLAENLKGLEKPLDELWERSALVAATCFVTARATKGINPDEAMLTGLLHGIGKLYLLTRARHHPALFERPGAYEQIVETWHANVAKAILENWQMPMPIVAAVHEQDDVYRSQEGPADLTDVLIVGNALAQCLDRTQDLEARLQLVSAVDRLNLTSSKLKSIVQDSREQIDALHATLGK